MNAFITVKYSLSQFCLRTCNRNYFIYDMYSILLTNSLLSKNYKITKNQRPWPKMADKIIPPFQISRGSKIITWHTLLWTTLLSQSQENKSESAKEKKIRQITIQGKKRKENERKIQTQRVSRFYTARSWL